MKILTQDRRTLIDTSEIFLNDIDKVMAISMYNSSEIIQIAKYKDFSYQTEVSSFDIRTGGWKITTKSITPQEICNEVIKCICDFFSKNPNGIYKMPTQEEIEEIIKGE